MSDLKLKVIITLEFDVEVPVPKEALGEVSGEVLGVMAVMLSHRQRPSQESFKVLDEQGTIITQKDVSEVRARKTAEDVIRRMQKGGNNEH